MFVKKTNQLLSIWSRGGEVKVFNLSRYFTLIQSCSLSRLSFPSNIGVGIFTIRRVSKGNVPLVKLCPPPHCILIYVEPSPVCRVVLTSIEVFPPS